MWTDSIKVVAKLDSIRKKQAEREGVVVAGRKNKRARADDLLDSLASIQEQQRYQAQLLNTLLLKMNNSSSSEHSTLTSPVSSPPLSPCNSIVASPPRSPPVVPASPDSLEAAFSNFLQVYHQVDVEERPRKIRKLMDNMSMDIDKKKEIKEIGCVLADFTDTQNSPRSEESVYEQQEPLDIQASMSSNSFSLSSSLSLSSEMRSFLGADDVDFVDSSLVPSEPSEADLQNWNSLLHDYLVVSKDM